MANTAPAHTKVTRLDWIDAALDVLDEVPVDRLRVLGLASRLSVSRSSFYWYFENLDELHAELLTRWERNTASIVERAERESVSIVAACLGVFECWADPRLYNASLDLAVRDWGRRDASVAARVEEADRHRHDALAAMFARHDFDHDDAIVRARLVYHSQVGYYAVGTDESTATRLAYLPHYLEAMTGATPTTTELAEFAAVLGEIG